MGKFLFISVRKLFFSENACFEHNMSVFLLVWVVSDVLCDT